MDRNAVVAGKPKRPPSEFSHLGPTKLETLLTAVDSPYPSLSPNAGILPRRAISYHKQKARL